MMDMTGRLIAPKKIGETPEKAQWLTGEGGGAWFYIQQEGEDFRIKRFTPEGLMDCNRIFSLKEGKDFDVNSPFEMHHISHCAIVKVKQNGISFLFEWIEE